MSEEAIYDDGYYEGIKDVVNVFLMMHMEGMSLPEIGERIIIMRKNAKIVLNEHREDSADNLRS